MMSLFRPGHFIDKLNILKCRRFFETPFILCLIMSHEPRCRFDNFSEQKSADLTNSPIWQSPEIFLPNPLYQDTLLPQHIPQNQLVRQSGQFYLICIFCFKQIFFTFECFIITLNISFYSLILYHGNQLGKLVVIPQFAFYEFMNIASNCRWVWN